MLHLAYEDRGEADKPSCTHHEEDAEDSMRKKISTWVTRKIEVLEKQKLKWLASASLRGMSVTKVMDGVKYILLVLVIYA